MDAWTIAEDHTLRSSHVLALLGAARLPADDPDHVLTREALGSHATGSRAAPRARPRSISRFWDDASGPPADVADCLDTWAVVAEEQGCELLTFDDLSARAFVAGEYGADAAEAYDACPHPAMRSDLFRLCWLVACGGMYVDADDALVGSLPPGLLATDALAVQPLCYDRSTDSMVPAQVFRVRGPDDGEAWTLYVNNAPLAAPPDHPVLVAALERALGRIDTTVRAGSRWDVQETTGPGNLTAALVANTLPGTATEVQWLDWDAVAVSRYPLDYRADARNWRRWNGYDQVAQQPTADSSGPGRGES